MALLMHKMGTKCLTEGENNNHTCCHWRDMAGHRDLRQGESHLWCPSTLRGLRPTTTGNTATETTQNPANRRPQAKAESAWARAVHRTVTPLVDQKQL